jgi:hypothetical protein
MDLITEISSPQHRLKPNETVLQSDSDLRVLPIADGRSKQYWPTVTSQVSASRQATVTCELSPARHDGM